VKPWMPNPLSSGEGCMNRRRLVDEADSLQRGGSDGTAARTRRATGEALLVPPRKRRSKTGHITDSNRENGRRREGVGRAHSSVEPG
jgi:hypothetical protein